MKAFIKKAEFKQFLKDGITIMIGGFLSNGAPERLIDAILETDVKDLTIICNDGGFETSGSGKLIVAGRVKHLIASHIGTNPTVGTLMQEGKMKVTLVPQGTLVEQIRADGAGLGGVLTPTGLSTMVETGKQIIEVKGIRYLLEEPLHADMALIGGAVADQYGNLRYIKSMRNFNPIMATAADIVIADPREIVDTIDPEQVITSYPLIDYILEVEN
ncbi:MAG: 3-oxoacid CoA-transferase subunit A [Candidatus Izemoplasmatales bacterium]|jgi:acetate CoA/acetoacetate CoA-transferase alpha subunit